MTTLEKRRIIGRKYISTFRRANGETFEIETPANQYFKTNFKPKFENAEWLFSHETFIVNTPSGDLLDRQYVVDGEMCVVNLSGKIRSVDKGRIQNDEIDETIFPS